MRGRQSNGLVLMLLFCSGIAIIVVAAPRPLMADEQQRESLPRERSTASSDPAQAPADGNLIAGKLQPEVRGSGDKVQPATGPLLRQPWDVAEQPAASPAVADLPLAEPPAVANTPNIEQILAESGVAKPLYDRQTADSDAEHPDGTGSAPLSAGAGAAAGDVGFIAYQPPVMPVQPPVQPQAPPQPLTTPSLGGGEGVSPGLSLPSLSTTIATGGSTTTVGTTKDIVAATQQTDLAGALQSSNTGQTVQTQQRSPVSMDPNIRGFKQGQIYALANGAYWTPARQDLDTMLSKIDPSSIEDVFVINGPYGLRYGPGFAFIDVKQAPTPRYRDGFHADATTLFGIRTNGQQTNAREVVEGGDSNYGFRFAYGDRQGTNYHSGAGFKIPSGFHNRDERGEFGFDLTEYRRVEFSFQRLDQTNTDYPGEFFDISWLGSYGLDLRMTDENPMAPWTKLSVGAWYNRTDFIGNVTHKSDPDFPMIPRVEYALSQELGTNEYPTRALAATSDGNVNSAGARTTATFGDADCRHFNLGSDFRCLGQRINEYFTITGGPAPDSFMTNMPRSWMSDVGTYAELVEPVWDEWTTTLGVRGDVVNTTARAADLRAGSSLPNTDQLEQNDFLFACYLTNRYELNDHWAVTGSVGFAERPPTLIERYADGLFLGVLQTGFTRVIGDPTLEPEKNLQCDLSLNAEYARWRGRLTGFQSWVTDYITYRDAFVPGPSAPIVPRLLEYRSTDATLAGFEVGNEYDLSSNLTAFMTMGYVDGRDRVLHAPLPSIPPLSSTAGLRLHDCAKGSRWGVEVSTRMVDGQDRLGTIYSGSGDQGIVVEEPTSGFMIWNLRSYYNYTKTFHLMAGIENVFDRNYLEHLDLRVGGPAAYANSLVYRPGFTPYFGLEWNY